MTTPAQHIADACLKIAAANHYLVGFTVEAPEFSWEELSGAKQILINIENADPKCQHNYDLAFDVLQAYCWRVHHCEA